MSECYSFVVNGVPCSTEEEKPLLRYLRDELRLTSVKDGCSEGACGTCTILVDGKAVKAEKDPALIAGAAGVALCLGADFVKVNPPKPEDGSSPAEALKVATMASGRTGLVCAGGSTVDAETFLTQLYDQIHTGGAVGNATGRNIHQRSLDEAVRLTKAISAITLADYSVEDALDVFNGDEDFKL